MIVVDTNVVAYFVIEGKQTPLSEAARSRDADWRVPALFLHEWLNVIAQHVHRTLMERDEAIRAYRRGLSLVKVEPSSLDPVRLLNLVATSGCSSYDLQFVTLAEDLGAPLVTADKEVIAAFPDQTLVLAGS